MKPDLELERVLRSGSGKERDALAKEAPLDVLLPALDSLTRRQNRKLAWGTCACVFMAIQAMGYLGKALDKFAADLHKWFSVTLTLNETTVIVFQLLCGFFAFAFFRFSMQGQEFFGASVQRQASILLGVLAGRATRNEVGRLCAIYWRTRGSAWVVQEWVQERHVAPLLLNLDDDEAQKLPEDAKRWIRWRLKRGASPEFRVAALLALSSGGDRKVASVAQGMTEDADERVRGAASEALKILEARR